MIHYLFQFLFIEGADIPNVGNQPYKIKESIKSVSPNKPKYNASPTFHNGKYRTRCCLLVSNSYSVYRCTYKWKLFR